MNSFFGLGPMELVVIVFLALIVLGPQRLPGTIREVMKYWRYFRNLSGELTSQLSEEFKDLEDLNPQRMLEDLATELEDEVEETKKATGIIKPDTKKKSTAKKPVAKKPTSAAKSSTESGAKTSTESSPAETATSDVSAAETASAAAAAAVAKNVVSDPVVDGDDSAEVVEVDEAAVSADAVDGEGEPLAAEVAEADENADDATEAKNADAESVSENVIMPPDMVSAEQLVGESNIDDNPESSQDGDGTDVGNVSQDGYEGDSQTDDVQVSALKAEPVVDETPAEAPSETVTKKPLESAEPAPVSVNGKGVRPEDEG